MQHSIFTPSSSSFSSSASQHQFWVWGSNRNRELGVGHRRLCRSPVETRNISNLIEMQNQWCSVEPKRWVDTSEFILACTSAGEVYCLGVNSGGLCGHDTLRFYKEPQRIEALWTGGIRIAAVACGDHHSLARSTDGRLFAWGSNDYGELGTIREEDRKAGKFVQRNEWLPRSVPFDTSVKSIAAGRNHSLALLDDGRVFSCGKGESGALGHGSLGDVHLFREIELFSKAGIRVLEIGASVDHSLALAESSAVYTWGRIYLMGGAERVIRPSDPSDRPRLIVELLEKQITSIACVNGNSVAISGVVE